MIAAPTAADALFIGPHPDDVDLFCGGTIASLSRAGHRVVIVDLSRGELATHGTPDERAAEANAASAILGAAARINLGLPDGFIGVTPHLDDHLAPLVRAIRNEKPTLVAAPAAVDRHPDHEATHALVKRALFLAGLPRYRPEDGLTPYRPRTVIYYPMHSHMRPDLCIDTTDTFNTKQLALDCFSSQLSRTTTDAAITVLNRAGYRESLMARDQFHGGLVGTMTAEPFLLEGPLLLGDAMKAVDLMPATTAWRWQR